MLSFGSSLASCSHTGLVFFRRDVSCHRAWHKFTMHHVSEVEMDHTQRPNKPTAPNPAEASRVRVGRLWRRVGESGTFGVIR